MRIIIWLCLVVSPMIVCANTVQKINEKTKVGLAYLYDDKESRKVVNASAGVNGTFTDSAAHLVTASLKYKF
mgnify:CR=1 FL=1